MDEAKRRLRAAFEFFSKLGVKFWAFHDRYGNTQGAVSTVQYLPLRAIAAVSYKLFTPSETLPLWG